MKYYVVKEILVLFSIVCMSYVTNVCLLFVCSSLLDTSYSYWTRRFSSISFCFVCCWTIKRFDCPEEKTEQKKKSIVYSMLFLIPKEWCMVRSFRRLFTWLKSFPNRISLIYFPTLWMYTWIVLVSFSSSFFLLGLVLLSHLKWHSQLVASSMVD